MRPTALLAAVLGALVLATPAAGATGSDGHYRGTDEHGDPVRFDLVDGRVKAFTVRDTVFVADGLHSGNHHVSITWKNATHAEGTYTYYVISDDHFSKHTRTWKAHKLVPPRARVTDRLAHGSYRGTDDRGRTVTFRYDGHLRDFTLGTTWGNREATVTDGRFRDREHHHELEGAWTDSTHVAGIYSYYREVRGQLIHVTIKWTARQT